tara:strand:- start:351 stop:533 length:183 start_codon:yes stop_codon:yes gene_type:complete
MQKIDELFFALKNNSSKDKHQSFNLLKVAYQGRRSHQTETARFSEIQQQPAKQKQAERKR